MLNDDVDPREGNRRIWSTSLRSIHVVAVINAGKILLNVMNGASVPHLLSPLTQETLGHLL